MFKSFFRPLAFPAGLLAVCLVVGSIVAMDVSHAAAGIGGMSMAMALVTVYAPSAKDPSVAALVPAVLAEARDRTINVPAFSITSGNSIGSKYYLGRIGSGDVPRAGSASLKHGAVTSVNSADIGLYKDDAVVNVNLFAAALDISSAGTKDPFAAITVATVGKRVWELLGLANDPGKIYDIVMTINVAATATASVGGHINYSKK